ncbi:aminopeptidase P family protein [Marinilongibacter aquaticus]|uniref:aminopeptidase P family protein n=1 Tax=Marinilongibacter aquaticus TaxID=2975157 RepID=UPI0021BD7792|nr:aminopeptidase P family protein [Marinilongibacter aquaticus]UBM58981.1 aminopeptidase P family protein [Marinilongibacter aquaticus]
MRYKAIPNNLFIRNRENFVNKLNKGAVALFCSNDVLPTNADGVMGFKQNADLFYLTGIDQEETFLFLFPDHPVSQNREVLFIRETNAHLKVWEGEKLSKEQAKEISGIGTVLWSNQLPAFLARNLELAQCLYLDANEHDGRNRDFQSQSDRFNAQIREQYPLLPVERAAPILSGLRTIKSPEEIEQIQKALSISEKAFRRIASKLKPGVWEFELEAEMMHEFTINRSGGHAFPPIVASGKNACVLHYVTNNAQVQAGDLVLMDFGASYANYNADITRCLPANGRFSSRQKEVYQAVLNVFHFAKKLLVVGNDMQSLRNETAAKMREELIKLGLFSSEEADSNPELYRKYFPHGVSHHLGLDVHDVGNRYEPFKNGMVFTCEPGIYIEEEGIGIRLENDILIQDQSPVDLAENIPIEIEDIENLMQAN